MKTLTIPITVTGEIVYSMRKKNEDSEDSDYTNWIFENDELWNILLCLLIYNVNKVLPTLNVCFFFSIYEKPR